jgi:ligand-binding SRPBCC domain-containing protein
MPVFVRSILLDAPIETVFAFHERPDALQLLSPPFPPVRVIRKTGGIEVGSRVELRIGPLPWIALHTAFEKNRLFEDQQISGPFARWVHRHEFETAGQGTRLTDRVDFQMPGGPVLNRIFGWAFKLALQPMFSYRHRVTRQYCEASA